MSPVAVTAVPRDELTLGELSCRCLVSEGEDPRYDNLRLSHTINIGGCKGTYTGDQLLIECSTARHIGWIIGSRMNTLRGPYAF